MRLLQFGRLGAGHLPVFFSITFTAMLGATYVFSVYRGDVDPVVLQDKTLNDKHLQVFPYISASGDSRPESCIFSMMLNICSFFSMLIICLRYSLVVELNRSSDLLLKSANRLALYFGILGGIGMFIVANFQETAVIQVHLTGAFMCFGFGCCYMLVQSWIAYRMHPLFAGQRIAHIRLGIAISSAICFFTAFFFGLMAANTFHRYYPDLPTPRPWRDDMKPMPVNQGGLPSDHELFTQGYSLHCISALAEWTLAVLNMAFLLSYSREFEKLRVELGVQPLVSHLDQSPLWQSLADLSASP